MAIITAHPPGWSDQETFPISDRLRKFIQNLNNTILFYFFLISGYSIGTFFFPLAR